ncbi:MAG: Asp-tRNA(Asn)/Glu-tRNA(Gln) amidotransferase subunit GatA [Tissierellia bacterium]|nr:Asp-tRNA(Asn)/Glu-tRNA(Gln) amidotransferase subunit GatA [Tissierellia bacterium]
MEIIEAKALELHRDYCDGKVSMVEIVDAYLKQIDAREGEINAFITLMAEEAKEAAALLDQKREKSPEKLGALAGVVLSIKDNIAVKGVKMTCASRMLEDFVPPYEATIIEKLLAEDAIIIGKVNMDEFAMGGSTRTSYFGTTFNPLDTQRVSGGSSGGSAASVAAHFCTASIGTDTGGSVRQPAAFCGVVGVKPTFGSISRYGVNSMANTFDQVGVLAQDVADAHYILKVLAGADERDATAVGNEGLQGPLEERALSGLKIAIPQLFETFPMEAAIKKGIEEVVDKLTAQGATVDLVPFDYLDKAVAMYHIIVNGELAPNMSRFDGVRFGHRSEHQDSLEELYAHSRAEGFGDEVKRRIMIGTHIMSMDHAKDYYVKALELRHSLQGELERVFEDYDLILSPTSPNFPFLAEEELSPVTVYVGDTFTVPVNLAGTCAISIPHATESLPMGIQLVGQRFKDHELLSVARGLEELL